MHGFFQFFVNHITVGWGGHDLSFVRFGIVPIIHISNTLLHIRMDTSSWMMSLSRVLTGTKKSMVVPKETNISSMKVNANRRSLKTSAQPQ